ncbi:AraC family transcriptional regulator [Ulvibacterium sp.]|uniref:helix-turn-helix domain-containing protein n=1 Tax=Ulvibacterium sp. TaxID=2665914 RepID=UPI00263345E6|nr:AraC family transcriptional regulator [Ulvibacterium sp.]
MELHIVEDVSVLINAFGVGNCFLLSYVYVMGKSGDLGRNAQLLSFLFFIIGVVIFNTILNFTGYGHVLHVFEPISNAVIWAMAPLLYLYIRSNAFSGKRKVSDAVHLLPFYFILSFTIWTLAFPNTPSGNWGTWILDHKAILLLWNLHFLVYLSLSFYSLKNWKKGKRKLAKVIFWSIASIWFLNLLFHVYRIFVHELSSLFYLNITLLFTFLMVWVSYQKLTGSFERGVGKNSRIGKREIKNQDSECDSLIALIREKKYYRDSDLNIRTLSHQLNMPYHELSHLINQNYNRNFNGFINSLRISEVEEALRSGQHSSLTIMGIAQRAGFKSSSVFYTAFKKEKGITPKAYIHQHSKTS